MLNVYFKEWGYGRLKRLPYLGYHILLMVLMMAVIIASIFAIGAAESVIGGDLAAAQEIISDKFGILAIFGFVVLIFVVMFAQINILAKRIRDMGLPALWTILGIIAVSVALNIAFPAQEIAVSTAVVDTAAGTQAAISGTATQSSMIVQGFDLLLFLCLILIPSDTFGRRRNWN
jgi:uncharacterized membrane protein YhaH (DUF805 family)